MNISYTIHQPLDAAQRIDLPASPQCRLLGRFTLEPESLTAAARLAPTVMVVDIAGLALGQVVTTLGRMRAAVQRSRLVVIGDAGGSAMAQLAVASGAGAYLSRDRSSSVVLNAVQEVAKGKWFLSGTGKRAAVSLLSPKRES